MSTQFGQILGTVDYMSPERSAFVSAATVTLVFSEQFREENPSRERVASRGNFKCDSRDCTSLAAMR
jgi:hypothetical protein